MARNVKQKKKLKKIEQKYDKLIAETLKAYQDRTMAELWVELDRLKEEMGKELNEVN